MTSNITIMNSAEFGEVRTVLRGGEPWFAASDVCKALELGNTSKSVARLDDDEKAITSIHTPGGEQNMLIVNEPGLYTLILGSRKPEAKTFKRWITHDVLPTLRKQGFYSMITDEVLLKVLSDRRRKDSTYLFDGIMKEREKLYEERWEETRHMWEKLRFDLESEQVDRLIKMIWEGDPVGADKAKEHYYNCCNSKYGMSRIYGKWKKPKPFGKQFKREKELIEFYERHRMHEAVENAMKCEYTLEECTSRMEELQQQDRIALQRYNQIVRLRTENEQLKSENKKLKSMLGIVANE